jgi:hypothetical protein
LGFCEPSTCSAGYIFNWVATSANPSSGAPITVELYLNETAPDTNLQLFGAAGASYQIDLAGVGTLATPVGNPGFDGIIVNQVDADTFTVSQVSILGLTPTIPPNLLIGSFQINYSTDGNGTLTVSPFGSGADIAVYDNALVPQVLDGVLFPGAPTFNFTFNTAAVPEPASLLLCVLGAGAMALRRRTIKRSGYGTRSVPATVGLRHTECACYRRPK